jgi:hypothetical protein
MELLIPATVHGELLFQQSTSAIKALGDANKAFDKTSSIAATVYRHRVTIPSIKRNVQRKLDKWIADKHAIVRPVPHAAIDWPSLIEKATWREPPFTYDPKDRVNEKGFRDALILETLVEYSKSETRDMAIVFLCGDNLLRTTAQKALKDDKRCMFYQSLDDFASYIMLTQERLTNHFINLLLSRATEKFFKQNNENCLYFKARLREKFDADYKEYFDNPENAEPSVTGLLGALLPAAKWAPSQGGRYWIGNAKFARLEGRNTYHWLNPITHVRLYAKQQEPAHLLYPVLENERVLILSIEVSWRANVKADGRFHDVAVESIELKASSFSPPTEEQVKRYRLGSSEG